MTETQAYELYAFTGKKSSDYKGEPSYNSGMTSTTKSTIESVEEYTRRDNELGAYKEHKKHGGAYDRGAADAWYSRYPEPHQYPNGTGTEPKIERDAMSALEVEAYWAGYIIHEADPGYRKQWD